MINTVIEGKAVTLAIIIQEGKRERGENRTGVLHRTVWYKLHNHRSFVF